MASRAKLASDPTQCQYDIGSVWAPNHGHLHHPQDYFYKIVLRSSSWEAMKEKFFSIQELLSS